MGRPGPAPSLLNGRWDGEMCFDEKERLQESSYGNLAALGEVSAWPSRSAEEGSQANLAR